MSEKWGIFKRKDLRQLMIIYKLKTKKQNSDKAIRTTGTALIIYNARPCRHFAYRQRRTIKP